MKYQRVKFKKNKRDLLFLGEGLFLSFGNWSYDTGLTEPMAILLLEDGKILECTLSNIQFVSNIWTRLRMWVANL